MQPIWKAWCVQIDVTNHCLPSRNCIYCTRFVRHLRNDQKFFMDMPTFENALLSVKDFPKRVGIIGGEPTLHPEFQEICHLIKKILPNKFVQLWTTGGPRFEHYKSLIKRTFRSIAYNEHNEEQRKVCRHQPITIAIQDVVADKKLMWQLIDDCWVQRKWCPTISHKGAFFCEVAYALDVLFDGPGGYEVNDAWWRRTPEQFQDQVKRYCPSCGAAIPIERETIDGNIEKISPGILEKYRQKNLHIKEDEIEIFDKKLTAQAIEESRKTWAPWNYRGDVRKDNPECG